MHNLYMPHVPNFLSVCMQVATLFPSSKCLYGAVLIYKIHTTCMFIQDTCYTHAIQETITWDYPDTYIVRNININEITEISRECTGSEVCILVY